MEDMTPREIEDEKMVSEAYQHLIDTYLASHHRKHTEIIDKAFNFAKQAHKGVRRLSGEPYIMHPIAVAQIACEEIGLGSTGICSALLHDVVEDTDYTVEDIANIFGPKIAQIVDGLTKISGGIFGDKASVQAESFKKLLLTMSEDIRVILIKISDRLHNMRTLGSQLPGKQYKIAGETLYIYAPLAHRLGLNKVKEELEDLSFRYEHPEEYSSIQAQLDKEHDSLIASFESFTVPIRQKLDAMGLRYEIKARIKKPYSIWNKMQTKHVTFDEVYDILAVRIVFEVEEGMDETAECFKIYAAACSIYKPRPDRLRDWLSTPKANGYQALHTTLMSEAGNWMEVQIRSRRMDDIAEHGFAAHWKYKEGETGDDEPGGTGSGGLDKWLYTIREILDDPQPNAIDFLDAIKLNLFANEIFVVTPKGEFKTMPAGCTVLDFAFSIHTFLGTHCIGAKVNHKLVGISHVLQSGDQVEILTSKNQKVDGKWIDITTTAKAKGKIQAILRREEREKQKAGEEILNEFFQEHEKEPNSINIDKLCRFHELGTREELLSAIGCAAVAVVLIMMVHFPFRAPEDDITVVSLDRFFLPHGFPLFVNLQLIMLAVGILFSTALTELFYAMMMVGFLGALLAQRFVFRDAEVKSEVVSGLILIQAALLMLLTRTQQIVHFAAPAFIGFGLGLIGSRFLLFFIKLSRHCQRGTSQSTFLLGWESGIAWGLGIGLAFFSDHSHRALWVSLGLVIAALIMYNFTHNWFAKHKNR